MADGGGEAEGWSAPDPFLVYLAQTAHELAESSRRNAELCRGMSSIGESTAKAAQVAQQSMQAAQQSMQAAQQSMQAAQQSSQSAQQVIDKVHEAVLTLVASMRRSEADSKRLAEISDIMSSYLSAGGAPPTPDQRRGG